MKISIFGLVYVGSVSAGCLRSGGHEVIGVDPNGTKVRLINEGTAPIVEKDIGDMIAQKGCLTAGCAPRRRSPRP